jgi:hypothetical protein
VNPVVEIEIEEVVLHGFRDCNPDKIRESLISELSQLLTLNRWSGSGLPSGSYPHIDGGEFQLRAGSGQETTAARIAGVLFQSLVSIHSTTIK